MHLHVNLGVALHALEDVQAAPAAVALYLLGTVSDSLQFLEYEARHDQLGIDNARFTNIGNPAVDYDTCIKKERLGPFALLGELDIRNQETEFILRLHQYRNGEI